MGDKPKPIFHEEQALRQPRQLIMLAAPPVGLLILTIWQVAFGHKWGSQPVSNGSLIGWTVFVWLLFWRLATVRLVTDVYAREVVIAMRGIWRTRRIARRVIRSASETTFNPFRDYGGYGIRSTRNGKAYIASGTTGVRLELEDGTTAVIGSGLPAELAGVLIPPKSGAEKPAPKDPQNRRV